jgi:hypothetical protein
MDIVERLRRWSPEESTHELLENAADEIEQLRNIRHYGLSHIRRISGKAPFSERFFQKKVYGIPLIVRENKVYPYPSDNVELYAYYKREEAQ